MSEPSFRKSSCPARAAVRRVNHHACTPSSSPEACPRGAQAGQPRRAGRTHNLPHGLGRHARVTVHQGLRRLREGVGDAVAEALSQAGPARGETAVRAAAGSPFLPSGPLCRPRPASPPGSHLFWMDFASQPLWPTIWVMFFASHQALLSGNRASLLMGGGAASTMTGRTAPTRTRSIVPSASGALGLSTDHR